MHGFAAPLGGMFAAPHGAVCAALLPAVLRVNARALAARAPDEPAPARRYRRARRRCSPVDPTPRPTTDVTWVDELRRTLEIPGLARYGMTPTKIPELVTKARAASSMKANPLPLTDDELTEIAATSL